MTARKTTPKPRPAAARKAAVELAAPPADHEQILHDAVNQVVATIRLGRTIGRTIPTAALALRLQVAAEEYARVEAP